MQEPEEVEGSEQPEEANVKWMSTDGMSTDGGGAGAG
jgi:hypothetical protein